jgi:hypothetical protein
MMSSRSSISGQAQLNEFLFFKPRNSINPVRATLGKRQLAAIIEAIHACWGLIETFPYWKSQPFHPSHFLDEDEISVKLLEILNHTLQNNKTGVFVKSQFQDVTRDAKQTNARADSYDQMPDLIFKMNKSVPNEDRSESGLIVECKLVSKKSGCSKYVANGMHRFVSGQYAPQMGFGMMIGYATTSFCDPVTALMNYFNSARDIECMECNAPLTTTTVHPSCYASVHRRSPPSAPTFCTFHLWLARPGVD